MANSAPAFTSRFRVFHATVLRGALPVHRQRQPAARPHITEDHIARVAEQKVADVELSPEATARYEIP